jgi:hypothetical protein
MRCNLAQWDRWLRGISGFALVAWAAAGGASWGWIGLYLLATSAWRLCPVAGLFGAASLR